MWALDGRFGFVLASVMLVFDFHDYHSIVACINASAMSWCCDVLDLRGNRIASRCVHHFGVAPYVTAHTDMLLEICMAAVQCDGSSLHDVE